MEEISFQELRKVHLQEKHSPVLFPLAENFFDVYLAHLNDFYAGLKDGFSIESAKVYENSTSVFMELVRLRSQKIILKAFKDCRLGSVSTEGLTTQEKTFYLSMLKLFNEYESSFSPSRKSLVVSKPVEMEKLSRVEMMQDMPQFVSPSGKTLGPFFSGDVVELDEETTNLLIEKQAAKRA